MRKLLPIILIVLPWVCMAQIDNPYDHCGEQFATQGTDFWVCFPRTADGMSSNVSKLYVVSERDCDVTVTAPLLDWSQTVHIMGRRMCGPDTNYINVPQAYSRFCDTVSFHFPLIPHFDYSASLINRPQPRAFHVTSTDTISLFLWISTVGTNDAVNVLPTELLRDEYVAQIFPNRCLDDVIVPIYPLPPPKDPFDFVCAQREQTIDIVAVEDSTVVDIVLGDWDLVGRQKGDSFSVVLNAGELYHLAGTDVREKYYPIFAPYYDDYYNYLSSSLASLDSFQVYYDRRFSGQAIKVDTFVIDLSGTHIKARDCKRIAVFEGGSRVYIPQIIRDDPNTSDMVLEQSVPVRYAGTKFLIPKLFDSKHLYIRITGLHDSTQVTIVDAQRGTSDPRHLTVDRRNTVWFQMDIDSCSDGPFYIETTHPAIVRNYSEEGFWRKGDESGCTVIPEEWWHHGQVNYGTITDVDENNNRRPRDNSLYLFAHTADVQTLRIDDYPVASYFHPISGTTYSYAHFPANHSFNTEGTHVIKSIAGKRFMATMHSVAMLEASFYNLPHVQPGGVTLLVNNTPSQNLPSDTLWCHFDHVNFQAINNRPADSLFYDFGDGTRLSFSHHDPGYSRPVPHTFPDAEIYTIRAIFTYEDEGCFTRKPDTVSVTLHFGGHVDTTLTVTVCEGSFWFRGHEFSTTDTHTFTTYWTTTGCDTLWIIDLVTCPHCHWVTETISTDDLPHTFNGITFSHEVNNYPVHISINDSCDSIIYYTLLAIPNWGEPPIDSTWVSVPNVFTPTQGINNVFSIVCSPHILQAEVVVFDRRGDLVTRFNGLTEHWDGTHNGRPCPQASYVYYIRYIDTHDKSWKTLYGTVSLIR